MSPTPHIKIEDFGKHIRIKYNDTGTECYLTKHDLVVQKDDAEHFFLKNSDYTKYIKFSDVAFPLNVGVDELIDDVFTMSKNLNNSSTVDSYIESSDVALDINVFSDKNPTLLSESKQASGLNSGHERSVYSSEDQAVDMYVHTINGNQTGYIIRQSKEYVLLTGRNNIALVSGTLLKSSVGGAVSASRNIVSQIGLYDQTITTAEGVEYRGSGILFRYENASRSHSIVLRVNGVDTVVEQSAWNIDKADGSGTSKFELTPTDKNTFVFIVGSFPRSMMKAGILNNGTITLLHEFNDIDTYFTKLPVRWEFIETNPSGSTLNASNEYMIQSNAIVYTTSMSLKSGSFEDMKNQLSVTLPFDPSNERQVSGTTPSDMIFSIKLDKDFIRNKIKMLHVKLLSTNTSGICTWKLVKNANIKLYKQGTSTLATPTSPVSGDYTTVSKSSILSPALTDSGDVTRYKNDGDEGIVLDSGFVSGRDVINIDLMKTESSILYSSIEGVSDSLSLFINYMGTTVTVYGTLTWLERE